MIGFYVDGNGLPEVMGGDFRRNFQRITYRAGNILCFIVQRVILLFGYRYLFTGPTISGYSVSLPIKCWSETS